jgi:UDP-glucuronate 4-epimerase
VAPATPHRIFNIGNDTPVMVDDFLKILEKLTGRTANRRDLPMQPGDVERTWADVSALRAAIGFAPRTTLEEGLSRFVAWYREYHQIR